MNRHPSEAQLNDFVDDILDARDRDFVETHIAACDVCRAEVAAIRALVAGVTRLEPEIAPARDLRADIAAQIARMRTQETVELHAHVRADMLEHTASSIESEQRPRRTRWPAMFVAAAVLVITTATLTRWWTLQQSEPALGESTTAAPPQSPTAALPQSPIAVLPQPETTGLQRPLTVAGAQNSAMTGMPASFRSEETRYLGAIEDLQDTLDRERAELAPQTIAILERNLAIIDRAIAESRTALARDPANRDLSRMVLSAYEQKLQLLQRARMSAL